MFCSLLTLKTSKTYFPRLWKLRSNHHGSSIAVVSKFRFFENKKKKKKKNAPRDPALWDLLTPLARCVPKEFQRNFTEKRLKCLCELAARETTNRHECRASHDCVSPCHDRDERRQASALLRTSDRRKRVFAASLVSLAFFSPPFLTSASVQLCSSVFARSFVSSSLLPPPNVSRIYPSLLVLTLRLQQSSAFSQFHFSLFCSKIQSSLSYKRRINRERNSSRSCQASSE